MLKTRLTQIKVRLPSHAAGGALRVPAQGSVRIGPLAAIPNVLEEFGRPVSTVLAEVGLDKAFFLNPDNVIPMTALGRLFGRCEAETGCAHFGLLVGQRTRLTAFGPMGYLVLSAPTLGDGLSALSKYMALHDRGGAVVARAERDVFRLGYTITASDVPHSQHIHAVTAAIGLGIMRELIGPRWLPSAVTLPFPRPRDLGPYRRLFGDTLTFDSDLTSFIFPSALLERPTLGADDVLYRIMLDRVQELAYLEPDELVERVRRFVRLTLAMPGGSLKAAVTELGEHERTLRRKLARAGTTFEALRNEARQGLATHLLRTTKSPVAEIAALVGYADASSFTRAFERWTGMAPTTFRASHAKRANRGPAARSS